MDERHVEETLGSEAGFTLVEVLVAISMLSIAFLGLGSAVAMQGGVASGATSGHAAVARSYHASTATMLAQERLEQVKRLTYTLTTDQMQAPTPTGFADEDFGTISGYSNFRREVRVQDYPAESMKTITVTVAFRVISGTGMRTESLALSTLVSARP
jgi:prepilin-type N-terminal cleavage/methylation domain-containing protein